MATIELVLMDCHSAVGFVQFHGDLVWVTGTSSEYTFLVFGFLAELSLYLVMYSFGDLFVLMLVDLQMDSMLRVLKSGLQDFESIDVSSFPFANI